MKYRLVSGIETHIGLATQSKMFCSCSAKYGDPPNTRCCPVCTGQPGALPSLNAKAIEYAVRAGLATHCTFNKIIRFDRKNYFYPDLPKAYQISQYDIPVCSGGYVELESGKKIRIKRIHLEEDAGKLVHERGFSFIDYNRSGIPLLEIVSEPDISSPAEAREYAEKLRLIMRYAGVSDCRMEEGSMRCDVNVSLSQEACGTEGTRTEIKNINSFAFIEKAVKCEAERQARLIDAGCRVEQATLRYDSKSGKTCLMRAKENASDYRYFPEPDIPAVQIPNELIERISSALPEMPAEKFKRYIKELGLNSYSARLLYKYPKVCEFFEECVSRGASAKISANLITGTVYSFLKTEEEKEKFLLKILPQDMTELVNLVECGKINATFAQITLLKMLEGGGGVGDYLAKNDTQEISAAELEEVCIRAIKNNPAAARDFCGGKQKAIGSFFGFVKRETHGRADIKKAEEILRRLLTEGL